MAAMQRPQDAYLVLDMTHSLDVCALAALAYIITGDPAGDSIDSCL